jgi:hypothetical protein
MGKLYISEINRFKGPWLIDYDKLESLNVLFLEIKKLLTQALERHIETYSSMTYDLESEKLTEVKKEYNIRT